MAGKVLLGLLAAAAVTGSAVLYSHHGGGCPLSAMKCEATAEAAACEATADETPACCAAKSRASLVCCEGAEESHAAGGDAMAAATGGICLGK